MLAVVPRRPLGSIIQVKRFAPLLWTFFSTPRLSLWQYFFSPPPSARTWCNLHPERIMTGFCVPTGRTFAVSFRSGDLPPQVFLFLQVLF